MPAKPKYKKEFCDRLVDHLSEGLSYESFSAEIKVNRRAMYQWEAKFPEWKDAKERGIDASLLYWEKMGRSMAVGKLKGSNAAVWIFTMKNRFGWRDTQPEAVDDRDESFEIDVK